MKKKQVYNLCLSAMFMAIGLLLPLLTGQIQQFGNMLLPMHFPVLLCGLICGWQYGVTVGFALPFVRSFIFGMPPLYPVAIAMAFELATYGFLVAVLYHRFKRQNILAIYLSMIVAMLAGRVVWGIAQIILLGINGSSFTWQAFAAGAFANAIPGIVLQLVFIPIIMFVLDKIGLVKFKKVN